MTLNDPSAMPEQTFYLIVRDGGSWGGGTPFRTYRGGVHEVSVEVAEVVLAWKQKHPVPWLVLSDVRPELEDGALVGLLGDLQSGVLPQGVRLLGEQEHAGSGPENRKNRAEAPPPVYGCQYCGDRFPSAAAAKRHLRHNHALQPDKVEARVRAQLKTEHE